MPYRQTVRVRDRLAARRVSILDAARALASEHGIAAVQIVAVAERAGIAAGTIYRYFPSKTALIEAVVAAVAADELAAIRAAAAAAPGPLSALAAAVIGFAGRAVRQRRLVWAVLAEPVDADVDRARIAFRTALHAVLRDVITAAMRTGQLADTDAGLAAAAVTGTLVEGLIGPLAPGPEPATDKQRVQMFGLLALRAAGLPDAHARGLIVQAPWPPG